MDQITVGYLSWKRHAVLKQTLQSHKDNGLYDIIKPENRIIFFQEITEVDRQIADEYNIQCLGDDNNVGILNAFIKLVEKCKTKYFIFCENDWLLIEGRVEAQNVFSDCINILNNNKNTIIKLRHIENPGKPLYSRPSNIKEWLKGDYNSFPYKLESLSWLDNPNEYYREGTLQEIYYNYKWYSTNLYHQKWSNNVFICDAEYVRNIILPLLTKSPKLDKYLGLEEILINYSSYTGNSEELDKYINEYRSITIAAGMGLFKHQDTLIQ